MAGDPKAPATSPAPDRRWRFAVVLTASLALVIAQPLIAGLLGAQWAFDLLFSLLILAVLLLVFDDRRHRKIAVAFGLTAFLSVWASHALAGTAALVLVVAAHLLAVCYFGFALHGILRAILGKKPSGDAIFGAVCGYILLGVIWSLLFSAVETASPGSFRVPASPTADAAAAQPMRDMLGYYSFITLTTLGYGDVTPATRLTQTLAWIEAMTGQFYLAILVAGLVGFMVTQGRNN